MMQFLTNKQKKKMKEGSLKTEVVVLIACNGQRPHPPQGSDHLIIKWEV